MNDDAATLAHAYLLGHGTRGALAKAAQLEGKKRPTKRDRELAAALRTAVANDR